MPVLWAPINSQSWALLTAVLYLTSVYTADGSACLQCLSFISLSMAVQALHLAVLRQHYDTVQALIDFGYPLFCKNSRKWMPLDEAVSLRDRRMVKLLHSADIQQMKALHRAKRGALLQTMQDMDDFTFKVWTSACCNTMLTVWDAYAAPHSWLKPQTTLCP